MQITGTPRRPKRRFLSVDWDFFFPMPIKGLYRGEKTPLQLWDWNHSEALPDSVQLAIWHVRAAGFLYRDLPLPGLSGEEKTFWQRVRFKPGSTCFAAESHCQMAHPKIYDWLQRGDEIVSLDAHHDAYGDPWRVIGSGAVDCGNWTVAYWLKGVKIEVRYPSWMTEWRDGKPEIDMKRVTDDGVSDLGEFDGAFICRSGAWVPPWLDHDYLTFRGAAFSDESRGLVYSCGLQASPTREFSESQCRHFNEHVSTVLSAAPPDENEAAGRCAMQIKELADPQEA